MTIYDDFSVFLREMPWFNSQTIYQDGLPEDPDDAVCVSVFPGNFERIQNSKHPTWVTYGVEIKIRSDKPAVCLGRCASVIEKLDGWTNNVINGTLYREIFLTSPAQLVFRDPGGQVTYSIGFTVTRRGMI